MADNDTRRTNETDEAIALRLATYDKRRSEETDEAIALRLSAQREYYHNLSHAEYLKLLDYQCGRYHNLSHADYDKLLADSRERYQIMRDAEYEKLLADHRAHYPALSDIEYEKMLADKAIITRAQRTLSDGFVTAWQAGIIEHKKNYPEHNRAILFTTTQAFQTYFGDQAGRIQTNGRTCFTAGHVGTYNSEEDLYIGEPQSFGQVDSDGCFDSSEVNPAKWKDRSPWCEVYTSAKGSRNTDHHHRRCSWRPQASCY